MLDKPPPYNAFYNTSLPQYIDPQSEGYFVFGSNLKGIHGAGAAKMARELYGAELYRGVGFMGKCYAIPTKDMHIRTLPLEAIYPHIETFVALTSTIENRWYLVTPVGCGLAGYTPEQIAPMFKGAKNCWFPHTFQPYLT